MSKKKLRNDKTVKAWPTVEILDAEHVGTTFRWGGNNLGSMNLDESTLVQEVTEEVANTRLNLENSISSCGLNNNEKDLVKLMSQSSEITKRNAYSQVKDTVVQTSVKGNTRELSIFLLHFSFRTGCIFQREGKTRFGFRNDMKLLDRQLGIRNSTTLDLLCRLGDLSLDQNNWFSRDAIANCQQMNLDRSQCLTGNTHDEPNFTICLLIISASIERIPWMVETPWRKTKKHNLELLAREVWTLARIRTVSPEREALIVVISSLWRPGKNKTVSPEITP